MIYLILLLGLLLRLIYINQSFWLDEAIGALVVKGMSFTDIAFKFAIADNHPPLYYLLLKFFSLFFGYSAFSLRLLSILSGLGIIYFGYKIGSKFTKINPVLLSLLLATSPILIYYSQEARMYILAAFFAVLAVYAFLYKKFVLFSISMLLLIFTDYVPVFMLPVFLIFSVINKYEIKKTVFSYIPLGVVGIFWLPVFFEQIETGRRLVEALPAWTDIAGGATFKNLVLFWNKMILGRISFYPKEIYYGLLVISSIPFVLSLRNSIKKENKILWIWFLLPLSFGFLTSFIFPLFNYFRFIYVIPAFYILASMTKNKLLITLMLVVNLIGLSIYYFDNNQHREDWKTAVYEIENRLKENEVIVLNYPSAFAPYQWYQTTDRFISVSDSISVKEDLTRNKVSKLTNPYSGVYYFKYLEELTDPQKVVRNELDNLGFDHQESYIFNGLGEVEYLTKHENSY